MSNEVAKIINILGYKIVGEEVIHSTKVMNFLKYQEAKGVFRPDFPNEIIKTSLCEDIDEDYVLAHELGHLLSYKHNHCGMHIYLKMSIDELEEHRTGILFMRDLEEFRADSFAVNMCRSFQLKVPEWMVTNRLPRFKYIPESIKHNINIEANFMFNEYVLAEMFRKDTWVR